MKKKQFYKDYVSHTATELTLRNRKVKKPEFF